MRLGEDSNIEACESNLDALGPSLGETDIVYGGQKLYTFIEAEFRLVFSPFGELLKSWDASVERSQSCL